MLKRILILAAVLLLSACASHQQTIDTTNLYDLETLTAQNTPLPEGQGISSIRLEALKETATSIGAQGGLAFQAAQIDKQLKTQSRIMDRIFDFQRLLLNHNVVPPVLEQGSQLVNLSNNDTIRIADKTFKIVSQARFVTTAPTWRQYLWMNYKKPSIPDQTLLPRDNQEREVWIKYIRTGWKQGILQAKNIYADNLARLKRDYGGMVLYRELLDKNMVSKPYVAKVNLGVTSNTSDTQLYINDQVLRITALPKLNPNAKQWTPVVTNHGTN